MRTEFLYTPQLAEYRFGSGHPLRPERFVLTRDLAAAWGLLADADRAEQAGVATVVAPEPCDDEDLLRAHDADYVAAVRTAGADPANWHGGFGIGAGDTPPFSRMHEAAALVAGATARALDDVASGRCRRAFSPAGGLHHAHRDHASGFCVYNDIAVAVCKATSEYPGLRVAYLDFDAHHGDGVQEAFYARDDVLTVSIHESGRYLFPGTGRTIETGSGRGVGFSVNVPLPPGAGDSCYELAFERVVSRAVTAFGPDLIVAQLGADSHRDDPLAHLVTTVAGQYATARRVVGLAAETCGGRVVAPGGGGYDPFSAVPRAWACALAALLGVEPPATLPESWRSAAAATALAAGADQVTIPWGTFDETPARVVGQDSEALAASRRVIEQLLSTHPLLRPA